MIAELEARLNANLEAARTAMEAAASEPFVEGSMGQLKPHPGFVVAARCDEVAAKLVLQLRMLGAFGPTGGPDGFEELDNAFGQLRARRAEPVARG